MNEAKKLDNAHNVIIIIIVMMKMMVLMKMIL